MIQAPFGLEDRSALCSHARSHANSCRQDEPEKFVTPDMMQEKQGKYLKEILRLCYNLLRVFLVGGSTHEDSYERKRNQRHVLAMAGDNGVNLFIEHLTLDVGATGMMINLVQDKILWWKVFSPQRLISCRH